MRFHQHPTLLAAAALGGLLFGTLPAPAEAQDPLRDHFLTGFPLTGAHESVSCESCHVRGVFAGTPTQCTMCHGPGGLASSQKPPNHIATVSSCDDCHTTNQWLGARFDHASVTGSCASCHNGISAMGKHPGHIQSSNQCEDCHGTVTFAGARFDHSGITGGCFSCHNGGTARGKPGNHIPSANTCEDCHGTTSWLNARFDHSNITGNCASCHNNVTATGKPPMHVQTSASCEVCHSTNAWIPAGFDHSNITGNCVSCHNNVTAMGQPTGHFVTSIDCVLCHNTNQWLPISFSHASATYPGDHRVRPACVDCHQSNSQVATWTFATYQPDCAGCHANDYKRDEHKKVDSPKVLYTVGELRDCTGSCHMYRDATLTTIEKARSGEHSVNKGGW